MTGGRLRYGIVGGGIAGLSAALEVARRGHEVTVLEAAPVLGGLASSFEFHGAWIDRYYHFICGGDHDIVELVRELGVERQLHWRPTRTYQYVHGKLHPFNGAADLLAFDAIPFPSRVRFGLHAAWCRFLEDWRRLDHHGGSEWLRSWIGPHGYEAVWGPLLRSKFGPHAEQISAPWIWHRIHRLGSSRRHLWSREQLGYLEGGSKPLFDGLERALAGLGVRIRLGAKADALAIAGGRIEGVSVGGEKLAFDRVLLCCPLPAAARLLPPSHAELACSLERVRFIAVVCVLLLLERPLTDGFWINVNDPRVAMSGFIEYSNLDPLPALGGRSLCYVPYYVPVEHPMWNGRDEPIVEETVAGLEAILPGFRRTSVIDSRVFRDRWAQPVCLQGFGALVPPVATGVEGLSLIDSTQLYPADRSRSGMIGLVRQNLATLLR